MFLLPGRNYKDRNIARMNTIIGTPPLQIPSPDEKGGGGCTEHNMGATQLGHTRLCHPHDYTRMNMKMCE